MTRRTLLFTICLLWTAANANASPVDVEAARQKAAAFMQRQAAKDGRKRAPSARQLHLAAQGKDDSYYIFNAADNYGGFVVVSGDDATNGILGYSDTGAIKPDSMPCGMRALLHSYDEQIRFLRENGVTMESNTATKHTPERQFRVDEERLAHFGQGEPYNDKCPRGGAMSLWERCPTGCLATAMAQLMYSHKWPQAITNDIPGYVTATEKYERDTIAAGTAINWSKILQTYTDGDYDDAQGEAIADLMVAAGTAVRMDYVPGILRLTSGGSSASGPFAVYALQQYFGYKETASYEYSDLYSYNDWTDMLRKELEDNGPVIYRGTDTEENGHFFMIEGYDTDGFFDINWGWNGEENGKFSLILIEGSEDRYIDYHIEQQALVNVKPRNTAIAIDIPLRLTSANMYVADTDYSLNEETGTYKDIGFVHKLMNPIPKDASFDYAVCYRKKGETACSYSTVREGVALSAGEEGSDEKFTIDAAMTDGKYRFWIASRETGKTQWQDNYNSRFLYTQAIACGNRLNFQAKIDDGTNFRATDIASADDKALRVGIPATITLKANNTDTSHKYYDGALLISVAWTDKDGISLDSVVAIGSLAFNGSTTTDFSFTFTPFVKGSQELHVMNKWWNVVGGTSINVLTPDESQDLLEVTAVTFDNADAEAAIIYGTYLKGTLTMRNLDDIMKKERLSVVLTDVNNGKTTTHIMPVQIDTCATVSYGFSFTNLTKDHRYVLTASYASGTEFYRSPAMLCTDGDNGETIAGNEELTRYEYWFDDDYDSRKTFSLGSGKAAVNTSIGTDGLEDGIHRLNFRVMRNDGMYSSVTSSPFLKIAKEATSHLDYWLDDNHDSMQSVSLKDTEDEQELTLDLSAAPNGFHRLNMRVATKGSVLSSVNSSALLKFGSGKASQMEYWFDDDRDNIYIIDGNAIADGYVYESQLNLSGITPGHHRLHYRAVCSDDQLATAVSTASIVVKKGINGTATLASYSLSIDDGEPLVYGTLPAEKEVLLSYTVDASGLAEGDHTLKMTFWNSLGASVTDWSPFCVTGEPQATIKGDVNGDGAVDVADIATIISVMAGVGADPVSARNADVNDDGTVDVADIATVISIMAANARSASAYPPMEAVMP